MNCGVIQLTPDEAIAASSIAAVQMIRKIGRERNSDHGGRSNRTMRERWADGVHGCFAELAVCRHVNRVWTPGGIHISKGECGGLMEVRATEHRTGHLLLYDTDDDDHWFVLAIGHYPSFSICKAVLAGEAKPLGSKRESDPPCFWIGQDVISKIGMDPVEVVSGFA